MYCKHIFNSPRALKDVFNKQTAVSVVKQLCVFKANQKAKSEFKTYSDRNNKGVSHMRDT